MTTTYRVIVQGLTGDRSPDEAARRLAALFKSGPEQVQPLLQPQAVVVKKGLTQEAAERYRQAIADCGCQVRIEPVEATAPVPAPASGEDTFRQWHALAEQGDAQAQYYVGQMYMDGEGTAPDHAKAAEWFRKSAEQGNAVAQYNLGAMYTDGTLPHDVLAAYRWMRVAEASGQPEARSGLEALEPVIPLRDKVLARIVARAWLRKFAGKDADPRDAAIGEAAVRSIVPVLRRAGGQAGDADPAVVLHLAGDLDLAFAIDAGPGGRQTVRRGMLDSLCLDEDELFALAAQNRLEQVNDGLRLGYPGGDRTLFRALLPPDGDAAALIVAPPTWHGLENMCGGPVRVTVPDRDTLLFCGVDDEPAFAAMCEAARARHAAAGADALSARIFVRDASGALAAHPMPPAPASDAPARLTGQASDPVGVTLSEARLRVLQPELLDPARWQSETERQDFLALMRAQLASGDSRAAVVLDAEHAVVAAYTDELDCVALLRFDPALARQHGWEKGTRLLTVNIYPTADETTARDLLPGENDTRQYRNFRPLIAELVSDDRAAIEGRKQGIGEDEWLRATMLGKQAYLDKGIPPRDGRPLFCQQPAKAGARTAGGAPRGRKTAPAAPRAGLRDFFTALGGFAFCALMVFGGISHIGGMDHDGLFYVACFGIAVFGLGGLWTLSALYR